VTAEASEVRVLTNSVAPESFKVGREKMRRGEQEVEMVVDGRTMESIRGNDWFGEEARHDLRSGSLRLWVHEEDIPYQMGILDDRLCLGAEDEDRMPVAMLETENEDAVEWGERTFEEYRERSRRLEASDV
jgi:predicted transcriptional regulator